MILYHVTIKINQSVAAEWLNWMQEVHIPDVMATGCFNDFRITRMLYEEDDDGVTFSVQYVAPSEEDLIYYSEKHAPRLQKEHRDKFSNQFVAYRTVHEIIG
jgi:hypothetical protein